MLNSIEVPTKMQQNEVSLSTFRSSTLNERHRALAPFLHGLSTLQPPSLRRRDFAITQRRLSYSEGFIFVSGGYSRNQRTKPPALKRVKHVPKSMSLCVSATSGNVPKAAAATPNILREPIESIHTMDGLKLFFRKDL